MTSFEKCLLLLQSIPLIVMTVQCVRAYKELKRIRACTHAGKSAFSPRSYSDIWRHSMAQANSYYDKLLPEAMLRQLTERTKFRMKQKMHEVAEEIIADELASVHFDLSEWIETTGMDRYVIVKVAAPKPEVPTNPQPQQK